MFTSYRIVVALIFFLVDEFMLMFDATVGSFTDAVAVDIFMTEGVTPHGACCGWVDMSLKPTSAWLIQTTQTWSSSKNHNAITLYRTTPQDPPGTLREPHRDHQGHQHSAPPTPPAKS